MNHFELSSYPPLGLKSVKSYAATLLCFPFFHVQMTTLNPATGEAGDEPLDVLNSFRWECTHTHTHTHTHLGCPM